jgi:hypothetical protein
MPAFSIFSKKKTSESCHQETEVREGIKNLISKNKLSAEYKPGILKAFERIPHPTDKLEIMEVLTGLFEIQVQLGSKVSDIIKMLYNHPKSRKEVAEDVAFLLQGRSDASEDTIIDIFMALASISSTRERKAATSAIKLITHEQQAVRASDIKTLIYRYLTIHPHNRLEVVDDILEQIHNQPNVTVDDLSDLIDFVQFQTSDYFETKARLKERSERFAAELPITEFLVASLLENQVNGALYFSDITNKLMEIANGMERFSWINIIGKLITGQKNAGNYILGILDTLQSIFPYTPDDDQVLYQRQNVADNVRVLLQGRFGIEAHLQRLIAEVASVNISERNNAVNTVYFLINGQMIETAYIYKETTYMQEYLTYDEELFIDLYFEKM